MVLDGQQAVFWLDPENFWRQSSGVSVYSFNDSILIITYKTWKQELGKVTFKSNGDEALKWISLEE